MALVSYIGNGWNISQISLKCRKSLNLTKILKSWQFIISLKIFGDLINYFNPIPTGQGRNQPLYERHLTKSGRNRVKSVKV